MPQTAVTTVAVGFVLAFAGSCVIFVPGLGCTTITLESEMQMFSSFSFLKEETEEEAEEEADHVSDSCLFVTGSNH